MAFFLAIAPFMCLGESKQRRPPSVPDYRDRSFSLLIVGRPALLPSKFARRTQKQTTVFGFLFSLSRGNLSWSPPRSLAHARARPSPNFGEGEDLETQFIRVDSWFQNLGRRFADMRDAISSAVILLPWLIARRTPLLPATPILSTAES